MKQEDLNDILDRNASPERVILYRRYIRDKHGVHACTCGGVHDPLCPQHGTPNVKGDLRSRL